MGTLRILLVLLLVAHSSSACTVRSTRRVEPGAVPVGEDGIIVGATTSIGQQVRFDSPRPERMEGGAIQPAVTPAAIRNDSLIGSRGGRRYVIPVEQVRDVEIEESPTSVARTAILVGAIGLGIYVVVGAVAFEESW